MASEVVVRHIGPVSSPTFTQYGRELISTGRNHGLVCVLGLRGGYRLPHHDSGIWDKACANQVAPTHGVGTVTSREVMHDVDLSLRSGGKDGMILLWRRLTLVRHHETDQERRFSAWHVLCFLADDLLDWKSCNFVGADVAVTVGEPVGEVVGPALDSSSAAKMGQMSLLSPKYYELVVTVSTRDTTSLKLYLMYPCLQGCHDMCTMPCPTYREVVV
eukprot:CAMPEP_0194032992 /NCGR_PEP_ID=MMETSP0009_2-20130614/5816_1 /TAXON_ID=210454 /ORGANISM="Grammatophora oceanica, Strain CCMP 410" /LENGTH=216 /DNA_ID=CAMNT_0038673591 /DNA_START=1053 /DNA_END=1704 /DNA_ORIENTATION=+